MWADEASAATPDAEVQEEVLVLKAARVRDEARRLADAGDFDAAGDLMRSVTDDLHARGLTDEAEALAASMPTPANYDLAMRKRLHYESNLRRRKR